MNCVALPVNWIHPAPSRFRGPPGNPTLPRDPHLIDSSTRSTLSQSAGLTVTGYGHGITVTITVITAWAPWCHGASEVSRPSSRAHVPASSAARALTNKHKQTTCDERALLCSHRPFLRIRTFLSGVFPVFEAGTDLSISLREMNKSVCPRLEN